MITVILHSCLILPLTTKYDTLVVFGYTFWIFFFNIIIKLKLTQKQFNVDLNKSISPCLVLETGMCVEFV